MSNERSRRVQIYVAPENRKLWEDVAKSAKDSNISLSGFVENAVRSAIEDQREGKKRVRIELDDKIYVGHVSEVGVTEQNKNEP